VNVPGGEIFTSLQAGVVDAAEWVGPYNDLSFGLHKIAKYYYYPGWHEPGPTLELIINKDAFNTLPNDLKEIVRVAARATNQDMLDEYTARNNAALVDLVEKHHIQLRKLPDDVIKKLHEITDQVLQELADNDPSVKKIYDSFKAFQTNVKSYHKISEQAYINARDL
jgi:TRAP-type mannitol/chloroaromatic compound transport system substrate-binding protein